MTEDDNLPVGLLLCAQKNDTLVRYATMGMAEQLFVSEYQVNLPSEEELQILIREEQARLGRTQVHGFSGRVTSYLARKIEPLTQTTPRADR